MEVMGERKRKKKNLKKKADQVHKPNQLISPSQVQYMHFDINFLFLFLISKLWLQKEEE